jgi:DNA modification methylase
MNIENKITRQGTVPWRTTAWLQPDDFKEMTKDGFAKLKRSILKKGFGAPFFVWDHPERPMILDGVHRKRAMLSLEEDGHKIPDLLPASFIECRDRKDAMEWVLAFSSVYAQTTEEGLYQVIIDEQLDFNEIKEIIELPEISMRKFEAGYMTDHLEEDEVPPAPEEPRSKMGDVYELGPHRLMCGDSTDGSNVLTLMADKVPVLMVTDPPYGVDYDPKWRARAGVNKSKGRMDEVTGDDRADWGETWGLFAPQSAYVWHAGVQAVTVATSLEKADYRLISQIIWVKDRYALSRGDYHWGHEPCWYAVREGSTHNWQGARDQSTTWMINRVDKNEEAYGHSTQKPIECMLRPIMNNSKVGELVVDPFMGTGTTLVAAEHSGRICYGMELEPKYIDVAVTRWCRFTKQTRVKLNGQEIEWMKHEISDSGGN